MSLSTGCAPNARETAPPLPSHAQVDSVVHGMMNETGARGLALAVIDGGEVSYVSTYGDRNAGGAPLEAGSIMYGASLTKSVFAYLVLQLVDEGIINLDTPISAYLPKPLPEYTDPTVEDLYARWSDLADDDRWKKLTPRILLTHSSGFANFGFLEPDGKLRFHFDPGERYSYSGDGIVLLQFVLERGLGLDVGHELQVRIFTPLGMHDTSLMWRDDFAGRAADGWTIDGTPVPHDDRSAVRASGSMDLSVADLSRLVAAIARGDLISAAARKEFSQPQLAITSASQFPTLQADVPPAQRTAGLAAGLGVVVFDGPQGHGFYKGGHNEFTGDMMACLETTQRCVAMLGNDLRAEAAIPFLVDFILGPTGVPWRWEYGDAKFWASPAAAR
ncbi:MAG: serine hydrolase domain-containing protein [Gemmatimonadaceae bacterium]